MSVIRSFTRWRAAASVIALALLATACLPTDTDHGDLRVRSTSRSTSATDVGAFRLECGLARVAADDPIVYPGQPGAAHLHLFFGNTGVTADSTNDSLRSGGNSTCQGGIANRSSYWLPAAITDPFGLIAPADSIFYYKLGYGGVSADEVRPMPDGLKMIAGNTAAGATGETPHAYWGCDGRYIGKPSAMPTDCGDGVDIEAHVVFPQCWDGRNLDSPDHRSHMAYASGGCPSSHPVALPQLTLNVAFQVDPGDDVSTWRLSSDRDGVAPGSTLHADWMNGWDRAVASTWVDNCIRASRDCHSMLLGDGTTLY